METNTKLETQALVPCEKKQSQRKPAADSDSNCKSEAHILNRTLGIHRIVTVRSTCFVHKSLIPVRLRHKNVLLTHQVNQTSICKQQPWSQGRPVLGAKRDICNVWSKSDEVVHCFICALVQPASLAMGVGWGGGGSESSAFAVTIFVHPEKCLVPCYTGHQGRVPIVFAVLHSLSHACVRCRPGASSHLLLGVSQYLTLRIYKNQVFWRTHCPTCQLIRYEFRRAHENISHVNAVECRQIHEAKSANGSGN